MSRVYSAEELELFARYEPARADHRPAGCNYAADCWVAVGPPGLNKVCHGFCVGCGCSIMDSKPGRSSGKKGGESRYTR